MGKEKFKVGMRCFVEGVISETNGAKDYPISVAFGGSSVEVTFTDTGLYRTTHSAPSLFTSEEVAAKLHPDLVAEIERLRGENKYLKANSKIQMQRDEVFLPVSEQVEALTAKNVKLLAEIELLKTENESLLAENKALKIKKEYSEVVVRVSKDAYFSKSAQVELLQTDNELVRKENERITKICNDLNKDNQDLLDKITFLETEIESISKEHNNTVQDLNARLDYFMSKYQAVSRQLEDEILRRHRALPAEIDKATEMLFAEKLEMQNEIELKEAEINTLKIEKNFLLKLLKFKKR